MIDKLGHYSIQNIPTIYDEEALTALELAGRVAAKVNESVGAFNKLETETNNHLAEQDKQIDDAENYMVDNLPVFVEKEIGEMAADGTLSNKLLAAMASGKVDKGGNEQVTYAMLAQDVKEAMTGGSVAVVGEDGVNTSNLVNASVTNDKLAKNIRQMDIHTEPLGLVTPLIIIDQTGSTASINPAASSLYHIHAISGYTTIDPTSVNLDYTTYWEGTESFSLWYDSTTKIIYIAPFDVYNEVLADCYCMGRISSNQYTNTLLVPVEINGLLYHGQGIVNARNLPRAALNTHITMHRYHGQPDAVVFDINSSTREISIVVGGQYSFYCGYNGYTVDFATVLFNMDRWSEDTSRCYVYYCSVKNTLFFQNNTANIPSTFIYLGILELENPHVSTLVIPFSVDSTYLYNPKTVQRPDAHLLYYPRHHYTKTMPYVDYINKRIVLPSVMALYLVYGDDFFNLNNTNAPDNWVDGDFVIPFGDGYQFIVGGCDGIRAVDNNTFKSLKENSSKSNYFYLGCLHAGSRHSSLNFDYIDGAGSLSILGDSISAFEGEIPEGNNPYYTGESKEQSWWNAVMRRCGLYKNTVQAWSGRCVTSVSDTIPSGVEVADQLDNGTAPDNIIVYLGTNDFRRGVPLGTYDCRGPIPSDASTFREAYAIMLDKIMSTYPAAKVYACTLPASERNSAETGLPEKNTSGVYLFEYNEAIREIARRMNVEVIELETCAINYRNGETYMWDYGDSFDGSFTHPNTRGHKAIANKVIQSVLNGRNYNGY